MRAPLVLPSLMETSVSLNGLFIPSRNLEKHLTTFCKSLNVWTRDPIHKIQLLGSGTPVKFRDRYLVVCSAQQLDDIDPKDVCLLYSDGGLAITSSGVRYFKAPVRRETDEFDIAVFDFTEALEEHTSFRSHFWNFDYVPPTVSSDHVLAILACGFPFDDQVYELWEKNHLRTRIRAAVALLENQPTDHALLKARYQSPLDIDPNGMSGGPVYVVQLVGEVPTVYLGGMMLRSGREYLYFLKSGFIMDFLNQATMK